MNATHPNQGVCPPVRPVHVVAKQRDRERVGEELVTLQDLSQIGSVVLDRVDRVGPVAEIVKHAMRNCTIHSITSEFLSVVTRKVKMGKKKQNVVYQ